MIGHWRSLSLISNDRYSTNELNSSKDELSIEELDFLHEKEVHNPAELQNLLVKLMKKEAELQRLKKEKKKLETEKKIVQKNYNTITGSFMWKFSSPLRIVLKGIKKVASRIRLFMFGSKLTEALEKNKELAQEITRIERQLKLITGKLNRCQVELKETKKSEQLLLARQDELNEEQLVHVIAEAHKDGEILDCIDELIRIKSTHSHQYSRVLNYAAKLFINQDDDVKHNVYNKVIKGLKVEEIPEFIVRSAENSKRVSLHSVASFRASLSMRSRMKQMNEHLPDWILDNKKDAYEFVDDLSIRRPWVADGYYKFEQLELKEGTVLKPKFGAGSRGVYLVIKTDKIYDVKRSTMLNSWDELEMSVKEDFALRWVTEDKWTVEELILEDNKEGVPARDLKFYCFYGKIGLVLEVKRYPEVKYCWWTPDGHRVFTGKYSEDFFEGKGFSKADLELVQTVSSQVPAPFMRIDFLQSKDGLVFGEFTPKPGNYDQFDKRTDQLLGEYYLEAEARLLEDLISGKEFIHFKKIVANVNNREREIN